MSIVEKIIDKHGFDFNAFEFENEYSAKNLLAAMKEVSELSFDAGAKWNEDDNFYLERGGRHDTQNKEQFIKELFKPE